jgi:pyruvate-ferredoxin/flavodoxin oxidoreductase
MNQQGRGPAWSNSLFEDNAEFGLGMRLSLDKQSEYARELLKSLEETVGTDFADSILKADQSSEAGINAQRERVRELKKQLQVLISSQASLNGYRAKATDLVAISDTLVSKSVWIVGGDGWAYDIGFGGLDHVLASGQKVNILVLDTEVYSNTGGQMSKSTPCGAVAKFAAGGKDLPKKDLALMAMSYGTAYVARIAMGANDTHTIKTFLEAEAYEGPSLIIAYSHCIAHGYDLVHGLEQQKAAVLSGHWPLLRFNPSLTNQGKNPLQLDSKPPSLPLQQYLYNETRYTMLAHSNPARAKALLEKARSSVASRWRQYEHLASMQVFSDPEADPANKS